MNTVALLTNMDTPLGLSAGNAIEVAESVQVLAGGGPQDVVELTVALAEEMLAGAGVRDVDVRAALNDGRAMDKWRAMISAQGGDPDAPLPQAKESHTIYAPAEGSVLRLDAMDIGLAAWTLGAGRARKEDAVQAGAGVQLHVKPGALVRRGQPIATLLTDTPQKIERAAALVERSLVLGAESDRADTRLIIERITAS